MDKTILTKILDDRKNGKIEILNIVLKNGVLIQFLGDYVVTYSGQCEQRSYIGRNPEINLKANIWGEWFVIIGHDCLRIKPSFIAEIDKEDVATPE